MKLVRLEPEEAQRQLATGRVVADDHRSRRASSRRCRDAGQEPARSSWRRRRAGSRRASRSRCRRSSTRSTGSSSRPTSTQNLAVREAAPARRQRLAARPRVQRARARRAPTASSRSCRPRPQVDALKRLRPRRPARARATPATRSRATAHPIELESSQRHGRTWVLSAQVQAYALALTIAFLALLLAAGALAAERDENVIGRLVRGLGAPGRSWSREGRRWPRRRARARAGDRARLRRSRSRSADVTGGEPWQRLPLVAVGARARRRGARRGSARSSARSPATRARRRSSRCSSSCRSSSSASCRRRSCPPPAG